MGMWYIYVIITAATYVIAQVFLRISQLNNMDTAHIFITTMGICGLIGLISTHSESYVKLFTKHSKLWPAVIAGILYYIGNFAWVLAIKTTPNLGLIGILENGLEMSLLILAGLLLFSHRLSIRQCVLTIIGSLFMIAAVY